MKRVLLLALLSMTGCVGPRQMVPMPNQSKTVEDSTKTRIYVMRPSVKGAVMSVFDGHEHIGDTWANSYVCWERAPGKVAIRSRTSAEAVSMTSYRAAKVALLKLVCNEGTAYYVLQHEENELELLSEEEGKRWLSECRRATVM